MSSTRASLKQLNKVAERQSLDLEFQDLVYVVKDRRREVRRILKSISGQFKSEQVTAILGPSGAGKSTLLNILAGYIRKFFKLDILCSSLNGVRGTITTNNRPRNLKLFNKLSCFIEYEDLIQPHLSVDEAMSFAADVKLGPQIDGQCKQLILDEVLELLSLQGCRDTRSNELSGGERKRLAIALELLRNPPVIFLDEPTTGLDDHAAKQCVDLLHTVSRLGRTVITTVHQPSSSMFQNFDQVYVLAEGRCVYNGSPTELVNFLNAVDRPCPIHNTPAEYIIELVHMYPQAIPRLSAAIENGKINKNQHHCGHSSAVENHHYNHRHFNITTDYNNSVLEKDVEFSAPFRTQLRMLTTRMFLQMSRNKLMIGLQFFHHLLLGVLSGLLFYGIGKDGSKMFANHNVLMSNTVFFLYTYVMTPVLILPLEIKLMKREYFNRWYGLKAYYVALTLSSLPLLIILGFLYSVIIYVMTDQPMELDRFVGYYLTGLMIGATSQAIGLSIGAIFSITNGSLICPALVGPLLIISVYGKGYKEQLSPFMEFVTSVDYLKHGFVSYCNSVFYKRAPLECSDDILCYYYNRPEVMMHDLSVPMMPYFQSLGILAVFLVAFRILFYFALRYRLNRELSGRVRLCVQETFALSRLLFENERRKRRSAY